jgi:hypothetical protein
MELETKNESREFQTTKTSISSFLILPEWVKEHNKLVQSKQLYEKPVHHLGDKFFMMSTKRNAVLEVQFRMHFHLQYETDLLLVMDIDYC